MQPRQVNSRVGRTHAPESRELWVESERPREAGHGHVRQPEPPFPLVDAQGLQTPEQIVREGRGTAVPVVADEHPNAPGLPVPAHLELRTLGPGGGVPHRTGHGLEVASGPGAEEGQRDVEVSGRHDPPVELAHLPGDEALDDVVGQTKRAEEA